MNWYEIPKYRWRNTISIPHSVERDFQRQKCYDAEHNFKNLLSMKNIKNAAIPDIKDVQEFVDKICSRVWFKRRWGNVEIEVKPGQGRRKACANYTYGYIKLPLWARTEIVILHELAHTLTPHSTGGGHGRYWARTFLELIEFMLGVEGMKLLRKCYKFKRVKYCLKKQLSPEVREAARKRFIENVLKKD